MKLLYTTVKGIIAEDQKLLLYKTYDMPKVTLFFQLIQLIKSNDSNNNFQTSKTYISYSHFFNTHYI